MHTKMQLMAVEVTKVARAALKEGLVERATQEMAATEQATRIAVDLQDIMKRLMRGDKKAKLEEMVSEYRKAVAPATDEQKDRSSASQPALEALAVPSGTPLSTFDPNTYPACYPEYLYGDCVPFLERKRPVTCQQVFAALPDREELEYTLPSDDKNHPYKAAVRSRFDTPEFYAAHADILRRVRTLGTVNASLARQGFEQDWHLIAATTSKDFVDAALAQQRPRRNSDIMDSPTNPRAQSA